ncbi:hypothetical protein FocTR4_00005348 [Fusarium oxysporum f. sp. cubense]|uniref:Uncharacterized protein n=1 Tax=Fusarium oxysporum f. sp. cubense TaxID=61366 RepID=A0A5C6TD45_FUSOC|nr:hypothetical protein FocTR4_00005348 [Fusarium oxysporum f. sp. cubense]
MQLQTIYGSISTQGIPAEGLRHTSLPGKIDFHSSLADCGAKGWELDVGKLLGLLEKATPAIALRKANDDEISQSGIDELLDDDEEIWEDFSDDESAGDLFMRFEEKHTLDNSVDGSN